MSYAGDGRVRFIRIIVDFVVRGWRGEERLWKVTWLGYVGGAFVLAVLAYGLVVFLGGAAKYAFGLSVIALNVWGLVAMWRCAGNVNWRGWFYLGRTIVIASLVAWILEAAGLLD